jgi:uncharacterized protein (TIGR02246 family)
VVDGTSGLPAEAGAGVEAALQRMVAAWDAGDADAFAAEFTDDASYVLYTGTAYVGRRVIAAGHEPVLQRWRRGSRMEVRVRSARLLADDVVVVLTDGGIGTGRRIRRNKVQTFTFVRRGGAWRCAAFQNTKRHPLLAALGDREVARLTAA